MKRNSCARFCTALAVAVIMGSVPSAHGAAEPGPCIVIRDDFSYGLMDAAGNLVVDPIYDRIDTQSALSAGNTGWIRVGERSVREDNRVEYAYAVMRADDYSLLTPYAYDEISPLCPGYAAVSRVSASQEPDSMFRRQNWGVVRIADGREIIPIREGQYCGLLAYVDGRYYFNANGAEGSAVYDEDGEVIVSSEYEYAELCTRDGRWAYYEGYYDSYSEENPTSMLLWKEMRPFDGYIMFMDAESQRIAEVYDFTGSPITELMGEQVIFGSSTDEDVCVPVYLDGMVALGNARMEPLTEFIYDDIYMENDESGQIHITAWHGDKTDVLDIEGNVLFTIPDRVMRTYGGDYETVYWFEDEAYSYSMYAPDGTKVELPPCDSASRVGDDRYVAIDYSTGLSVLINTQGDILLEEMLYMPQKDLAGGLIIQVPLGQRSFYGLSDMDGQMILPAVYNAMECVGDDLYYVRQGMYEGYINRDGEWIYRSNLYATIGE